MMRAELEMLAEHERRVLDGMRAAASPGEDALLQPPSGGVGVTPELVQVTGFGNGLYATANSSLMVKRIDGNGAVTGAAFEALVRSFRPTTPGRVGEQNLATCTPRIEIGDEVAIVQMTYRGALRWVLLDAVCVSC